MRIATLVLLALIPAATTTATGLENIAWFNGKVEDAFVAGKTDNKPLFLYWGAVWCPPCNQIKKTIFTRREFADKMKLFIPVYLDGDTEQAQIWGERLKASGYPTMIVFSPAGKEITRIPTGLQLDDFIAVLDQALHGMTPIKEVLAQAMASTDGSQVTDATWQLLAYYSWGQATDVELEGPAREETFRQLAARVPERLTNARARLFELWLESAVSLSNEEPKDGAAPFALSNDQVVETTKRIHEILASPALTLAVLESVTYGAGTTVKALYPKPSPARTKLIAAWEQAADRIENDESLSVDERVSALLPPLELHQLSYPDKEVPAAFKERVKSRAWWANEHSSDLFTRQAAMSTAGFLLRTVGLEDDARKLYLAQLDKAVSPHYFMSSLSSLAKKAGNTEEAVDWLKKAYDGAEGRATRFQWGTSYLQGLMTLVPKDSKRIEAETVVVFKELLGFDDSFAGRNHKRIQSLSKSFAEWNKSGARAKSIATLKKALASTCDGLNTAKEDGDESQRERCSSFFASLGS